jgi:hypothetical protein
LFLKDILNTAPNGALEPISIDDKDWNTKSTVSVNNKQWILAYLGNAQPKKRMVILPTTNTYRATIIDS